MKIVIRAGGAGTRLWPASRENNPKQFQALISKNAIIRDTVNRVKPLLKNAEDLFVSLNQKMVKRLKKEISGLPRKNMILESVGKNTGPAMCLESCFLARRFGEETIVASLPSDDFISDAAAFREMLREAENFLKSNPEYIITPGAKPTCPDEGYSYIKIGKKLGESREVKIFKVGGWIEKPKINHCKKLIKSGKYFYHTGMYVWRLKTVLDLFRKFQPKIHNACQKLAAGKGVREYAKLEKISVESAITNRAPKIAVAVSEKFIWSDLGKWQIISEMIRGDKTGNVIRGKNISIDTKNCLVYSPKNKLVATIGLDDFIVVLTEDALLVCPKDRAGDVKKIIDEIKKRGLKKYL